MRKIKASGSYLKNQVRKNLTKATVCALIFTAAFSAIILRMLTTLKIDILSEAGLVFLLVPLIAFYYYLRKYHIYSGGWQGEKAVAKTLTGSLNDDHYLINDLYLQRGGGDIDHVVLAPCGVFVLETKNWSGYTACHGDTWQRVGKRNFSSSPSRQAKQNAARVKRIIDSSSALQTLGIWVQGIVVFTNKHATLRLNSPTVPILLLSQLPNYIINHNCSRRYTSQELEAIAQEIIKQKR